MQQVNSFRPVNRAQPAGRHGHRFSDGMHITVERLYRSPGHNFFGHHGAAAGDHPIERADQLACVSGRGIVGDRFFDYRPDYPGQITFFSMEVFEELCAALDAGGVAPAALRRNVMVRGADLNALIGSGFEVQGVRFHGASECKPCYWMDQAIAPGAEAWLRGRGGLRARILSDGILVPSSTTSVCTRTRSQCHSLFEQATPHGFLSEVGLT